jgi:hypothetical protein
MSLIRLLQARALHLAALIVPLLAAGPVLAVTDRRSLTGATADVGPSIPEPSSILLFVIGVGVVGYGVHRRRRAR